MERDEFTMLVNEFKELVKGTKFENIIETDLDIQNGKIFVEVVMMLNQPTN
jgi:hypothetical protein